MTPTARAHAELAEAKKLIANMTPKQRKQLIKKLANHPNPRIREAMQVGQMAVVRRGLALRFFTKPIS